MATIPVEKRAALSRMISKARSSKNWSQDDLSERATLVIPKLEEIASSNGALVSPEEREAWCGLEVTRHHIFGLENCPAAPLGTHEKRGRLLAVCVVLELDRAEVNKIAGGI